MNRHALLACELGEFFTSALGCRSQTFDNTGLNASPDPEAGITDRVYGLGRFGSGETTRHRRVRDVLAQLRPVTVEVLARAYGPGRPLPLHVVTMLGGDESIARLVPTIGLLFETYDAQDDGTVHRVPFETWVLHVVTGERHRALRDNVVNEARALLAQCLEEYATVRRQSRAA